MGKRLEPIGDRIIVEVVKDDEMTAGGLVLPEQARERSQRGRVVAAGPGRMLEGGGNVPMQFEVEDIVLFSKYGGTELPEGSERRPLLVLRESDVLAIERVTDEVEEELPPLDPRATFHADQLTADILEELAAAVHARSEAPPTLLCASEAVAVPARALVEPWQGEGTEGANYLLGLFRVLVDPTAFDSPEQWRVAADRA